MKKNIEIENCLKQDNIQKIIGSEEFYYQKLLDLFKEFKNFDISKSELKILLQDINHKNFNYEEFTKNHLKYQNFLELIAKIISIIDEKAWNKKVLNPYENKRVVARSMVSQKKWLECLLKYKLDKNIKECDDRIKNAILFIENPEQNLTALSENHKKQISKNLLGKNYNQDTFFEDVKTFFEPYLRNITLKNEKNLSVLISSLLYCKDIEALWKEENKTYWQMQLHRSSAPNWNKEEQLLKECKLIGLTDNNDSPDVKKIRDQMKKGDIVLIHNGNKIIALVEVIGDYEYEKNPPKCKNGLDWFKHRRRIKILNLYNGIKEDFKYRGTINKIIDKNTKTYQLINRLYKDSLKEIPKFQNEVISSNQPLNQILYGPPGTGKTYNTINKALEILALKDDELKEFLESKHSRKELKEKFDKYKQKGQIEFVTFHQSYGYEEFVEGIKAETDEKGEIRYEIRNGIFKELANKALEQGESNFEEKIEELKKECSELEGKEPITIGSFEVSYRGGKTFSINPKNSKKEKPNYPASIENIKKLYLGELDRKNVYNPTYVQGILDYLYKKGLKKYNKNSQKIKNYILIIDEINRGNISKIFGELITLIEPSKRIGEEEEIKITLPYSNDKFGVPNNLYIIGTMNTADRSIALLDTALRRRFEFVEMMPEPELLKDDNEKDLEVEGINIKEMLKTINQRIEYLYDRDHTIGHSYFMSLTKDSNIDDLNEIFRNKIIPLLQEYFYDDYEKILMVLGNGFIKKEELKSDIFTYTNDDYLEENKFIYTIKDEFDYSEFK